jgi:hypothetical protein
MESALEQLRQLVVTRPELHNELYAERDRERFVHRVVEVAAAHGLVLSTDEIDDAMRAGRRSWVERWL